MGLYAKIVPKTQVAVARVHTCADVACVAMSGACGVHASATCRGAHFCSIMASSIIRPK